MKTNKGITLIALVITIVVLIILAGVAISLSIGENGIFNKAKYATEEYANEQAKEETEISKLTNEIEYFARAGESIDSNKFVELEATFNSGVATFAYPEGYNKDNTYVISSKAFRSGVGFYERYSFANTTTNTEQIYLKDNVIEWMLNVNGVTFTTAKILIMKID